MIGPKLQTCLGCFLVSLLCPFASNFSPLTNLPVIGLCWLLVRRNLSEPCVWIPINISMCPSKRDSGMWLPLKLIWDEFLFFPFFDRRKTQATNREKARTSKNIRPERTGTMGSKATESSIRINQSINHITRRRRGRRQDLELRSCPSTMRQEESHSEWWRHNK